MTGRARLVVTMSTIPSRISRIGPVLESIKRQTRKPDAIYVCICTFNLWEQSAYEVPQWLSTDEEVRLVISTSDFGPATKLLGTLRAETAPETRIVIVDDDWSYDRALLERLEAKFDRYSGYAIGSSGARLPSRWSEIGVHIGPEPGSARSAQDQLSFVAEAREDFSADILQFGFGAIVLRKWFADDIYDLIQPKQPLFYCDDVLFSAYLESKGIGKMCVSGISLPRLLDHSQLHPLAGDGRMTQNYRMAIPAISRTLGIWPQAAPPSPLSIGALRTLGARGVRKGYRIVRDVALRLTGDSR
jgi:hypothetical protein